MSQVFNNEKPPPTQEDDIASDSDDEEEEKEDTVKGEKCDNDKGNKCKDITNEVISEKESPPSDLNKKPVAQSSTDEKVDNSSTVKELSVSEEIKTSINESSESDKFFVVNDLFNNDIDIHPISYKVVVVQHVDTKKYI